MLNTLVVYDYNRLEPISISGVIHHFADATDPSDLERLTGIFMSRISELRDNANHDEGFNQRLSAVPVGPGPQFGTRFLVPQILAPFVKDQSHPMEANDAVDFYHTVVPVCYCDHVLLDSHWASVTRQAIARLKNHGHQAHYANIISPKGHDAIEHLIVSLGTA